MLRLLTFVLFFPLAVSATSLRLEGDRAWLETEGAPLSKVLRLFEQRGVEVMIDPSLDLGRISGTWDGVKTDRLIQQLVRPNSYLIESKRVSSPLGDLYRVSSIRIFAEGNPDAVRPISSQRVLDVVEGPDGKKYIRGEIMVGFGEESGIDDLKALLHRLGGTVVEVIDPPGIYRIKIDEGMSVEEGLEIAEKHDGVKSAEPNLALSRLGSEPVLPVGTDAGVNLHLQPGETAVAVLDSGLDPQYADLPFIRGMYNALNPAEAMNDPTGHGTLMAMVASGAITPLGADPAAIGVPVLAIRTFDENGYTSSDTIMRALDYAVNSGTKIVSMSWGSETPSLFIETAMNYAASKGLTLFASAGNEPIGQPIYPAGYGSVIAVGGLAPDGQRWEHSNFGNFVERHGPAYVWFNGKLYAGTSPATAFEAANEARK